MRILSCLALCLLARLSQAEELASPEEVATFEREHRRAEQQELQILEAVAVEGAVSLGGGIGLAVPSSHDDGLRVAGGINIGFGFVNVALSAAVIPLMVHSRRVFDREHEARSTVRGLAAARRKDADFARRQSTLYAINLGLDVGYAFAGAASLVASKEGVAHPDRWEGAGIALCSQSVFALAVDLASLLVSTHRQATILYSLTPVVSVTPSQIGPRVVLGLAARF